MNWNLSAVGLLAAVSLTNASAQTELPSQWLNEQMLATKLDRTTARGVSAAAIDATVVKANAVARLGTGTGTSTGAGAQSAQSKDMPQSGTTAAGSSPPTPK